MGFFVYDNAQPIKIEDRALAHLQIVMIDKMRRRENFGLNLADDKNVLMMWVSQSTPLQFVYEGNRQPTINWAWVELLAGEAGVTGVLELLDESRSEAYRAQFDGPSGTPS
jgi:hypothetical protein